MKKVSLKSSRTMYLTRCIYKHLFHVNIDYRQAYILGSQDPQFCHIIDKVASIVFLATPHRGSDLAETLSKFLTASFQSPKQYIVELQKNSARISDINDQFKLYADRLDLVSFFETQPTSVAGLKKLVSLNSIEQIHSTCIQTDTI